LGQGRAEYVIEGKGEVQWGRGKGCARQLEGRRGRAGRKGAGKGRGVSKPGQASKQARRQAGRQARRHGRQAGRQADEQAGMQAGKQGSRQAGKRSCPTASTNDQKQQRLPIAVVSVVLVVCCVLWCLWCVKGRRASYYTVIGRKSWRAAGGTTRAWVLINARYVLIAAAHILQSSICGRTAWKR